MLTLKNLQQETARRSHLEFMQYMWDFTTIDFLTGFHIEKICDLIDTAMDDYAEGKSSFYTIKVPFRHHKSQTVTRFLPPHFLGRFPESEIMVASYNQSLSDSFSIDARNYVMSEKYHELYPEVQLVSKNIKSWKTETKNCKGKTHWIGLGAGANGKGGQLIIVDDFLKGRSEAESETIRENTWQAFANDIMTRRPDPCIVIVLATPWHSDDIFGRISEKMKKDPNFPTFTDISFPAKAKDYTGEGEYPGEYLFPEKFGKEWYLQQYATLGLYNASGLLDCNPSAREGSILKCVQGENWHYVNGKPDGFGSFARGWDLASTEAQLQKDDPDWTIGVKVACKVDRQTITSELGEKTVLQTVSIYIDDIVRIRAEARKRNMKMVQTAGGDGAGCIQYVEAFAAYKDAYTTLKEILKGSIIVEPVRLQGDKISKITTFLEVPFEFGNVFVNSNIPPEVVHEFMNCCQSFPSGKHDDDPDALAVVVSQLINGGGNIYEGAL